MILVKENNYSLVDLNKETLTISELKYQKLLREQLAWLNADYIQVKNKSLKLYQLYIPTISLLKSQAIIDTKKNIITTTRNATIKTTAIAMKIKTRGMPITISKTL